MRLDNQQERLALLGYLAGIIDGEGWVGLYKQKKADCRAGFGWTPTIAVHMVGPRYIDHLDDVARTLGFPSYVAHYKTSSRWVIRGMKRTTPVLVALLPYLFVKREQAEHVIEYTRIRMQRPYRSDPTPEEELLAKAVSALNMKGKNPQRLYA